MGGGDISLLCGDGRKQKPFPVGFSLPAGQGGSGAGSKNGGHSSGWLFPSRALSGHWEGPSASPRSIPRYRGLLPPSQPASPGSQRQDPPWSIPWPSSQLGKHLKRRCPLGLLTLNPLPGSPFTPHQRGEHPARPLPVLGGSLLALPSPARIKTSSIATAAARNPWQISAITAGGTWGAGLITAERWIKSHRLSADSSPTRGGTRAEPLWAGWGAAGPQGGGRWKGGDGLRGSEGLCAGQRWGVDGVGMGQVWGRDGRAQGATVGQGWGSDGAGGSPLHSWTGRARPRRCRGCPAPFPPAGSGWTAPPGGAGRLEQPIAPSGGGGRSGDGSGRQAPLASGGKGRGEPSHCPRPRG